MYDDVSLFEDLPTEIIREIFDYLTPHHLLDASENLNNRFLSIITQQTLCLSDNDTMTRQTYQYYMKYILPKYGSQFASLHFSENNAVDSISEFFHTLNSNIFSILATSLRVMKIVDINQHIFQSLIDHFHYFPHVHTLLIRLWCVETYGQHDNQWNHLFDTFYLPLILKTMPQLRSLFMYQRSDRIDPPSLSIFNMANFPTAHYLHTLRISECSYQFLASLVNGGHVPRLRYIHAMCHCSSRWPM
jgi:hypothetical protein